MNPVVPVFLLRRRKRFTRDVTLTEIDLAHTLRTICGWLCSEPETNSQARILKKMKKRSCCSVNSGSVPAMTSSLRFTPYASLFTLHGNVYQG